MRQRTYSRYGRTVLWAAALLVSVMTALLIPHSPDDYELHVSTEYDEKADRLEMRFVWGGAPYDPLEEGEELSVRLIRGFLKDSHYTYTAGENRLVIEL